MYKTGDKFKLTQSRSGMYDNHEYVLATCAIGTYILIDRNDGTRWGDPITSGSGVSFNELKTMMGKLADKFVGIEGTVYPPKTTIKIGQTQGFVKDDGTACFEGRTYTKEFILNEFIPAWESRNNKYVCVKVKTSTSAAYLQSAVIEIEKKLNDGRSLNSNPVTSSISTLFSWIDQPEGLTYWQMADALFTLERATKKLLSDITIYDDRIVVGCGEEFYSEAVDRFIRDYKEIIGS